MVAVKRRKFRAGRRLCLFLAVILIFTVLVVAYLNAQIDKIIVSPPLKAKKRERTLRLGAHRPVWAG